MAERILRVKERDLLRTAITDGNVYACTDSRKLYQDVGNKRLLLNVVQISTEKKRIHDTTPSANTKYYVWETSELWLWKNAWIKLLGNPDYPEAYQYIDGDIYAVGGRGQDTYVDNNGLLGDGSVAVRDYNRVIKGKMYIDDTNDNLVIASFLGGGMKLLPNGNMEETGALYLDVDEKGTALHYNDFYNTNGELYVQYDETGRDNDPSVFPKSSHIYTVWHEGNLDASPLLNDELLRKVFTQEDNRGSTNVDNSAISNGFKVTTKNNDLETEAKFSTYNYWSNNTPVLSEIYIGSQLDPLKNSRIYGAKGQDGSYSFYLSYNQEGLPVSPKELNDLERLLNKSEIEQLINNKVRNAQIETVYPTYSQYKVTDPDIERFLKDGFIMLVRFLSDSSIAAGGVKINVNDNVLYDVDDNTVKNQQPLFFKAGNIYEFVVNGKKLILLNNDMVADYKHYGNVKVTNESSPIAETFSIVEGSDVILDDPRFRIEGNYAFKGMIVTKTGFPDEEAEADKQTASYVMSVRTSVEPDSFNNFEQILTNINENRIYKRTYNTAHYLVDNWEQGDIDGAGQNLDSLIYVREIGYHSMKPSQNMAISSTLPSNVQFKVFEYDNFKKVAESTWKPANQAYIFSTNSKTKFIRMLFRYSDNASQLKVSDVKGADIKIAVNGFSGWERMYPAVAEDYNTSERLKVSRQDWSKNITTGYFEYDVKRMFVKDTTLVEGNLDLENKDKIDASYIESYIGGFKIIAKVKPIDNFVIDINYTDTTKVENVVVQDGGGA